MDQGRQECGEVGGAFRKKVLSRAYQKGYGRETPEFKKLEKEHWHYYKLHCKKAAENRRDFKGYTNQYDDLFEGVFNDADDLIRILEELTTWRQCKLKTQMLKDSYKRLEILRELLDKWLNQQQQSDRT